MLQELLEKLLYPKVGDIISTNYNDHLWEVLGIAYDAYSPINKTGIEYYCKGYMVSKKDKETMFVPLNQVKEILSGLN